MSTIRLFAISLPALLCALLNSQAQTQWPRYRVAYLGDGDPQDLNDSTVVVAQSMTGTPGSKIWRDGVWRSLPSLLDGSRGMRINNAVQVAGESYAVAGNIMKATGWPDPSTVVDLGTLPGTNNSRAFGINSQGTIVGFCWFDSNHTASRYQAFTHSGSMAPLPPWGAVTGQYGMGINDSGDVVTYQFHPFMTVVYRGGTATEAIPDFGGYAINNRKVIAGENAITGGPAYWSDGTLVSLPNPLGGSTISDINDAGTIVGYRNSNLRGLIWKDGEMRLLEELTLQSCVIEVGRAINNKGEIVCRGRLLPTGTTGVLLLTPVGKVTAPLAGATWIAGEEDTVRWTDIEKGVTLTVELSTDSGGTYRELASHIPADSGKCGVRIPTDVLSTKCLIRLRDAGTLSTLAESEVFKVKPYVLTRKDPSTNDLVAYDFNKHRWGFWNTREDVWPDLYWYTRFAYSPGIDPFTEQPYPIWTGDTSFANAKDSHFPDWPSFVRAFTPNACYISLPLAVYSQTAVERWAGVRRPWGGSCFGIAGTNALAFSKRESFVNTYPHFAYITLVGDPIAVHSDTGVVSTVTEIFTHQFGIQSKYSDLLGMAKTPNQTLRELKEMLRPEETPVRTLTIGSDDKKKDPGYHTILAYRVERASENSPVWNVHVYDNSVPGNPDPIIEIDTSQNYGDGSWTPTYAWPNWGGRRLMWLEVPSESYLTPPTLSKSGMRHSPFGLPSGLVEVNYTRNASITIRDAAGNVTGYAENQVGSEIPGSTPLFVKNGAVGPPYGYLLASGNYLVTVDSFKTSESRVFFFTENRTMGYRRSGAEAQQTDHLRFDTTDAPTLSIGNPDPVTKSIMLKTILSEPALEKVYAVYSLELDQSDSVAMVSVEGSRLRLASYGSTKDYDVRVEHASTNGLKAFTRRNIALSANSTHTILPDWNTLGDSPLMILVDLGNDGSVDDTLHLTNEATGVHGQGSLIPLEYRLEQNYPNPFNPSTKITYELPRAGHVRLSVFDMLGREVVSLVNQERNAGQHEVTFDGSHLSSGVYLYQLRAGDYVSVKKMLLVR